VTRSAVRIVIHISILRKAEGQPFAVGDQPLVMTSRAGCLTDPSRGSSSVIGKVMTEFPAAKNLALTLVNLQTTTNT
jgi:hypothetical protein